MTLVTPKPNGGISAETRRRITAALPGKVDTIACHLNVSMIELDRYFSYISEYQPCTRRVELNQYVARPEAQSTIITGIHSSIPTIASILGETETDTKLYFESCFLKVAGKPAPTVTASATTGQKVQSAAACVA
jgi:hypothetical protein